MQTLGNVSGMEKHVERLMNVPNADITKIKENISIIKGSSTVNLHNRLTEIKENGGIVQKNSVVAIDCLMTASPEFWADQSKVKEDNFIEKSYEYLTETFGRENIMSMTMHKDETSPHIHAIVCPAYESKDKWGNKKMRVGAKKWLDGRTKLSQHQDRFAEIMEPLGLERGKKGSIVTHKTIQKFYSELEKKEKVFKSIMKDFPKRNTLISHDKYMKEVENHLLGFADVKEIMEDKKIDRSELINETLKLVNGFNKSKKVDFDFSFSNDKITVIQPSIINQGREEKKEHQKETESRQKEGVKDVIFNELQSTRNAKEINWNEIKMFFDKLDKEDKNYIVRNVAKDKGYISEEKKQAFFVITKTREQRDLINRENKEIKSVLRRNSTQNNNDQDLPR